MTENNHHDSAALDKLTEPFTVLPNDNPASDAKRQELIDKPAFGQVFSDNMAHMSWTKGEGWGDRRIEPYAPLKLDPGASVLHYAQEVFEGLKAYRHADGSTWLFRPDANAERFQNSAKRLYLPELSVDDFLGSVATLVKRDVNWVPTRREYTLYMRPFMFASEPFLGVTLGNQGKSNIFRHELKPLPSFGKHPQRVGEDLTVCGSGKRRLIQTNQAA